MGFWQTLSDNLAPILGIAARVLTEFPSLATPVWAIVATPFAAVVCFALLHVKSPAQLLRYPYRRVFKAIVSPRYLRHKSHRLDLLLLIANSGFFPLIILNAVVAVAAVNALIYTGLVSAFGEASPTSLDPRIVALTWAIVLLVAYELGYWVDHYLAHKIPFLWEFHKVHHSAEALSPITNFRMHPVDSLVFYNIIAVVTGITTALLSFGFGSGPIKIEMWGIITLVGALASILTQMQHTHIWLPIRGVLGRLILSPAHHQIHHSQLVEHHDRNFGNLLAVFDWLFRTLVVPPKRRPRLVFGVDSIASPKHNLHEAVVAPFIDAAGHLKPKLPRAGTPEVAAQPQHAA